MSGECCSLIFPSSILWIMVENQWVNSDGCWREWTMGSKTCRGGVHHHCLDLLLSKNLWHESHLFHKRLIRTCGAHAVPKLRSSVSLWGYICIYFFVNFHFTVLLKPRKDTNYRFFVSFMIRVFVMYDTVFSLIH